MDEQSSQQTTKSANRPLPVTLKHARLKSAPLNATDVVIRNKHTHATESGLAMLVNVIPRDEEMPGFVRGYN